MFNYSIIGRGLPFNLIIFLVMLATTSANSNTLTPTHSSNKLN